MRGQVRCQLRPRLRSFHDLVPTRCYLPEDMISLVFRSTRLAVVRRLISLVLLTCFGAASAETVLADSCDGDGGTSAIMAFDPPGQEPPGIPGETVPLHSVHVCHCAHTHAGPRASGASPVRSSITQSAILQDASPAPVSIDLEPPLRPPVR